ncbi:hypothetical protein SCHPADRAFT_936176 [Schizopora paradoxa]|uniref:BTB domain-containing protein n=1 Tax=Schizopora paradoxa TaxID=27342 RepID=A0A0H2S2G7_9AGAM|nr:hypothetical protein SCHPADRAFT_936176 [Schizopora paradoxa]
MDKESSSVSKRPEVEPKTYKPRHVVLVAENGERYKVDVEDLCRFSSVFSEMVDMPFAPDDGEDAKEPIVQLTEDSGTIQFLVAFLQGRVCSPTLATTPFRVLEVWIAADKYNAPTLQSFLRVYTVAYWDILANDPVYLVHLADRAGWLDLAWKAARETLKIATDSVEQQVSSLKRKGMETHVASRLLELHESRRDSLVELTFKTFKVVILPDDLPSCVCGEVLSSAQIFNATASLAYLHHRIELRPLADFLWEPSFWAQDRFTGTCDNCHSGFWSSDAVVAVSDDSQLSESLATLFPFTISVM